MQIQFIDYYRQYSDEQLFRFVDKASSILGINVIPRPQFIIPEITAKLRDLGVFEGECTPCRQIYTVKILQIKDKFVLDGLKFFDNSSSSSNHRYLNSINIGVIYNPAINPII